ncbi:hypothetical protein Fcan01_26376 [Folsomia candida]|uniref:Uncharacterized protein n=1 Tax=Folsomia candida TaxID=158441 RepID=A0A226CZM0_FOLCA|nr:hypothetical protein Fcan01_26376 [Folsomia candida]
MDLANLAQYINIFAGCVVNLINYENINIPSTISVPIFTTRYKVLGLCGFGLTKLGRKPPEFKVIRLDFDTNLTFPRCAPFDRSLEIPLRKNVGQQRGWKFLTRFYILPPVKGKMGVLPPDLYEEKFTADWDMMKRYYMKGYHVLVQKSGMDLKTWGQEMTILLDENSGLDMLLLLVKNAVIVNFQFCCRYCNGCYQVCYDIIYDHVDEIEIERVANKFNTIGEKTPWHILPKWIPPVSRSIRFSEVIKAGVGIDDVLLNLLLWRNATTKFGDGLVQNDTLLQDQCLHKGPQPPSINVRDNTELELVTSVRPYGFLSCSKKRVRPSSLENLVYVFTWDLWTLLISTWFFLGLFVMLTWKNGLTELYVLTTGYNILLEQGSSITKNSQQETYLYFVFAPWILMSLVMTNLIRGDNVQSTIAPLHAVLNGVQFRGGWASANTFSLANVETYSGVISYKVYKHLSNGSVHVDNVSELEKVKALLEKYRPGPEYRIGKEFTGLIPTGWQIQNVVDPRIPVRMRALHQSGIARKWLWYSEMAEKLRNRKPYREVGPEPFSDRKILHDLQENYMEKFATVGYSSMYNI